MIVNSFSTISKIIMITFAITAGHATMDSKRRFCDCPCDHNMNSGDDCHGTRKFLSFNPLFLEQSNSERKICSPICSIESVQVQWPSDHECVCIWATFADVKSDQTGLLKLCFVRSISASHSRTKTSNQQGAELLLYEDINFLFWTETRKMCYGMWKN